MTLDEAIIHAESEAWKKNREADNCFNYEGPWYEEKRACANEHKQLAEWLKELKVYREAVPSTDRPQGEWITDKVYYSGNGKLSGFTAKCSECGFTYKTNYSDYCPGCGAKMKIDKWWRE